MPRPGAIRPARPNRTDPTPVTAAPAAALSARRHLIGLYLLLGMTVSSWLSRLPSVRSALGLSESELGLVLLLGALGSLVTVLVAGGVVTRFGSRRTLTAAAVLFSGATFLMGLGPTLGSVPVLVVGVFVMSASFALGNVPMNVETVVIERAMGRTVVPQFHAAFSVGALSGSLLGAGAAWVQLPLLVQFGAMAALSLVWRLAAIPAAVLPAAADPARVDGAPAPRRGMRAALGAWRERRTLLVGVIVMTAALSEGSANNWLAIAVVDGFRQTEAMAAIVFGVFTGSMAVARFTGTWAIARFGHVTVLAASGSVAFVGLLLFGLAPTLPLAVLGVVGWGLGAGLVVPIGMAAVSHEPLRAAGRVAVVSAFASVSSIVAPPLLGAVAEAIGARRALLLVAIGLALSVVLASTVRTPSTAATAVPSLSGDDAATADADVPARRLVPAVAGAPSGRPAGAATATAVVDGHDQHDPRRPSSREPELCR
ncbi:MFS transporter [Actinotalea sp. Marseille-Q4924]|uniref:MFS transporter n=1 Tax=Actinotalea sp. Marseille-Q4924 TaxID=2866571 RepID=UPI001CE3C0AA|nr:MFS transporter [Actinotalea sp. Marseille-Q4924]